MKGGGGLGRQGELNLCERALAVVDIAMQEQMAVSLSFTVRNWQWEASCFSFPTAPRQGQGMDPWRP